MFDSAVLDVSDLRELDDHALVDAIQGLERLAARVAAVQLTAIAELARRRPRDLLDRPAGRQDLGDPGAPEVSEFAVDEVAAALRLSRPAAGARLHVAVELTRLHRTSDALRSGRIDAVRARAVVDAVAPLDDRTAAAVEERVLPRADDQTVGQLRASLSRAVLAVDPAGAEVRHQRAVTGRQVRIRPMADGMAELWALLSADSAAAVYAAVDTRARQEPAGGRDMAARKADALVAAVTGGAATAGGAPVARAIVHVTVPAATVLGFGDEPGELAGHGPVSASTARRLAAGARWRRVLTHPDSGVVVDVGRTDYVPSAALADLVRVRDRSCRFPGCRQPAWRCDIDHVVPWPAGPTNAANLVTLCRHHHRLKHQSGWTVKVVEDTLRWISPTGHRYATSPLGP